MKDYFVHSSSIIEQPCEIGKGTKVWHYCHIMPDCKIGEGCNFGQNVFVARGVVLGNNVKVQNNVSIYEGVICEDDVFLGPSMVFTNVRNPRSAVNRRGIYEETYLEQGVSIGANATIVCGVRLGKFCFIGAGAVVTKDVPAYALVVGNPARHIGWVSEYGNRLIFNEDMMAFCEESKQKYKLNGNFVDRIRNDETIS